MCGIAGFWNLNGMPVSRAMLETFTDTLEHRGPDGNGFYIDEDANLGLGHRRLAILDTTDMGRQPMSYGNRRYWITLNGEIYNFLEIRSELAQHGYQFVTESDTEVVMAAYDKWGEDCQLRFNGMWAFAIWDQKKKQLFISRDRFGVKPLMYFYDRKRFAFASEMKAFLALDWFQAEFDPEMVATALTDHQLIEGSERTLLRDLKRLLGGYCLSLKQNGDLKIRRWWNTLDHLEPAPASCGEQVERYRELFLDSCRIRMRSDVPIGTALSGGLDSSSIVCGMRHIRDMGDVGDRLASDWQRSFVATYPGSVIDERVYADEVIKKTGSTPVYCEITPDMYLKNYKRVLFQYEEISDIHLGPWAVHKAQREHGVVVTLDGHGGDEALAGYPWHVTASLKDALTSLSPRKAAISLETMKKLELFPQEQFYWQSILMVGNKAVNRMLKKEQAWLNQSPAEFVSAAYEEDRFRIKKRNALFQSLYADFHFTHLPMNLRDFDRLSMAHGVEVRSPFMDWRLVTFTFSLPSESKIGGGYTKRILRDALKDILPEPIRKRTRKLGFPNMAESWSSPRAQDFIRDAVMSADFQNSDIWDGKRIRSELEVAMRKQDLPVIQKAWIYVQAMSLMEMFREKRRNFQ
ncbi:MAG: asparagine synthase (glutamine-hydrolyzing) [Anaerolineales bacterium]|uniref:asparagine synthase (glutamine-hydrolyzing) n=1 Tax=Candidatus Desulfolinea nitratireducens TaxID=2841698 RepID=A0A8J6NLH8_9CHLR|nr:asparagine synthase (glutamine-hydrolyzing) [Candidatus Desulfolinea nitratireducens]